MPVTLTLTADPAPEDVKALTERLDAFFIARGAPEKTGAFIVSARDENGAIVGGLYAKTGWDQLYIDTLHVAETHRGRGIGVALMGKAEDEGRRHGCAVAWLDTSTAEAKAFYEARGYVSFGAVERRAPSSARHFLKKAL